MKETDPGHAYRILKKMGAQPGDCSETNTFTLPNHEAEGLSAEQSAERMAQHFAEISQQFPPLRYSIFNILRSSSIEGRLPFQAFLILVWSPEFKFKI